MQAYGPMWCVTSSSPQVGGVEPYVGTHVECSKLLEPYVGTHVVCVCSLIEPQVGTHVVCSLIEPQVGDRTTHVVCVP